MTHMRCLVLTALLAVGCSTTEEQEERTPRRVAALTHPPLPIPRPRTWAGTMEGREVVVLRADKGYDSYPREIRVRYELSDAATKEPLHTWASIVDEGYIQGVSLVFLLSGFGLLELGPAEVDEFLFSPERASEVYRLLCYHRDSPRTKLPRWRKLDLSTKELVDTDIVYIDDIPTGSTLSYGLTRRLPDERIGDRLVGRLDLEFISATGESLGRYERVEWPIRQVGRFRLIRAHQADGCEVNHLLGPALEPLFVTTGRMMDIGGSLMTQAPGTTPEQGLWVDVGPDGQPVRSPGVTGYRPVWAGCDPSFGPPMFFLARHAEGSAHAWGRKDATGASPPLWDAVELYSPPTLHRLFKFENIQLDEWRKHRGGYVSPIDNPVLLVQSEGRWEASSTVPGTEKDPRIVTTGATPDEALTAAFARYEERFVALQETARWENFDNKNRRYFDDWVAGRIDASKVDLGRIEWLAKKYGGVAVFHYVRHRFRYGDLRNGFIMKQYCDWAAENADRSDVSDADRAWLQAQLPGVKQALEKDAADGYRSLQALEEHQRRERELEERRREVWATPQPAPGGSAPTYPPSSSGSSTPGAYDDYYNKQYDDTVKRYGG